MNNDGTSGSAYMQLQPEGNDANNNLVTGGLVNFSSWTAASATPAAGSLSAPFNWEGDGYRITRPVPVASGMSYVSTISLANGVLSGTLKNLQTGESMLLGSFSTPTAVSLAFPGYSYEYYNSVAYGALPLGDVSFTNLTTNVASYVYHTTEYLSDSGSGYTFSGINSIQEIGDYCEVSDGGTANTVTLGGYFESIVGNGPNTTLLLTSTYADLTTDSVSGIQTLDLQGNMATMTATQYAGFTTFLHTTGGLAIKLPGNLASYNVAKGASGGFAVSSSTMASTFSLATKLIFADQTVQ